MASSAAFAGSTKDDLQARIDAAKVVLDQIMSAEDKSIPLNILEKATCVGVVPGMIKGAFVFGGQYGQGVVTCRTGHGWSAPAFIRMAGGSFGFQIGGQSTDLVLVAVNDRGFQDLLKNKFKIGGDALFVDSQYFVGDESNQAQRLSSYTVFNVHASYQIDKTFQIYARADNIFDNRYATYGTFFDTGAVPNFANGGAPFTDPRSISPARPRAFYAGVKATF